MLAGVLLQIIKLKTTMYFHKSQNYKVPIKSVKNFYCRFRN